MVLFVRFHAYPYRGWEPHPRTLSERYAKRVSSVWLRLFVPSYLTNNLTYLVEGSLFFGWNVLIVRNSVRGGNQYSETSFFAATHSWGCEISVSLYKGPVCEHICGKLGRKASCEKAKAVSPKREIKYEDDPDPIKRCRLRSPTPTRSRERKYRLSVDYLEQKEEVPQWKLDRSSSSSKDVSNEPLKHEDLFDELLSSEKFDVCTASALSALESDAEDVQKSLDEYKRLRQKRRRKDSYPTRRRT